MVVGENGVLNRATDASKKTNDAKAEELRQMAIAEAAMNFENTEYEDKNGKKVTIPAGFAPTRIEGEDSVEDGLVIIDSKGNEFVWIPCDDVEKMLKNNMWVADNENYNEKEWKNIDSDGEDHTDLKKKSVEKFKGFYVGRYEAGVPNDAPFYILSDEISNNKKYANDFEEDVEYSILRTEERTGESVVSDGKSLYKPVSKRRNQGWNFINQSTAKVVSESMYLDNKSVNSYLIDSNAWNYICSDIFEERLKKENKSLEDSSSYGNYYDSPSTVYSDIKTLFALHEINGSTWRYSTVYRYGIIPPREALTGSARQVFELATGSSDDFKIYNIYDMAGNFWEWTSESSVNSDNAIIRGGSFYYRGFQSVVFTNVNTESNYNVDFGFRVVLYLK